LSKQLAQAEIDKARDEFLKCEDDQWFKR